MEETTTQTVAEIDCPYCAEKISTKAKKCKHCGEIIDAQMRDIELLKNKMNSPQVITNVATSTNTGGSGIGMTRVIVSRKSRGSAVLWAILLGGIGAHKFYLGQSGMGFLYLIFSWTGVPMFLGLCEGIYYFAMSPAEFDAKYNTYVTTI